MPLTPEDRHVGYDAPDQNRGQPSRSRRAARTDDIIERWVVPNSDEAPCGGQVEKTTSLAATKSKHAPLAAATRERAPKTHEHDTRNDAQTPIEKRAPRRPVQRRREGEADLSNYHKTGHSPDGFVAEGEGRKACVCGARRCRRMSKTLISLRL